MEDIPRVKKSMSALVFVDTNVLLYALDDADLTKQAAARAWRAELWKNKRGRVSFQVLQEFYAVVERKWPAAREDARAEIRDLLAWRPTPIDADVLERAWGIQNRYKLSFWDALIVAAAIAGSCRYVLSEDLQHQQKFDAIMVVNPFLWQPDSLPPE
jgi:predicted nucleic acid-binding protein